MTKLFLFELPMNAASPGPVWWVANFIVLVSSKMITVTSVIYSSLAYFFINSGFLRSNKENLSTVFYNKDI